MVAHFQIGSSLHELRKFIKKIECWLSKIRSRAKSKIWGCVNQMGKLPHFFRQKSKQSRSLYLLLTIWSAAAARHSEEMKTRYNYKLFEIFETWKKLERFSFRSSFQSHAWNIFWKFWQTFYVMLVTISTCSSPPLAI